VGALAIAIGILAQGQNVAHLVALASRWPPREPAGRPPHALLEALQYRRRGGRLVVGTLTAIGLVLISPT